MAEPFTTADGASEALQRLADSLQVLVLVLPGEASGNPRALLVAAAAKQALEDISHLQGHLVRFSRESRRRPEV